MCTDKFPEIEFLIPTLNKEETDRCMILTDAQLKGRSAFIVMVQTILYFQAEHHQEAHKRGGDERELEYGPSDDETHTVHRICRICALRGGRRRKQGRGGFDNIRQIQSRGERNQWFGT